MKISIIIPVYNVEPYIKTCLQSVFNQSYKNIEIILVDDCGKDNSMEIIKTVIDENKNLKEIKILRHKNNRGLSAARNTGIENSTGDYIYFLDSDDTLPSNSIELLVSEIKKYNNDIDFVIGAVKTYGNKNYIYPLLSKPYIDNNNDILNDYLSFKWNVMACNKLISKKMIDKYNIKFIEGIYHEDMDFSFKLALHATKMACCYNITYNYLIRENSITTYKKEKNYNDYFSIIISNLKYLKNKHEKKLDKYSSNYIIETLYILCLEVIKEKNPNITYLWKKEKVYNIHKTILSNFKILKPTKVYKIKLFILSLPVPILSFFITKYIQVKHL